MRQRFYPASLPLTSPVSFHLSQFGGLEFVQKELAAYLSPQ
jgi:hypothetical protein